MFKLLFLYCVVLAVSLSACLLATELPLVYLMAMQTFSLALSVMGLPPLLRREMRITLWTLLGSFWVRLRFFLIVSGYFVLLCIVARLYVFYPLMMYFVLWYVVLSLDLWERGRFHRDIVELQAQSRPVLSKRQRRNFAYQLQSSMANVVMNSPSFDRLVSVVEAAVLLSIQLADASNPGMQLVAIASFVKSTSGPSSLTKEISKRLFALTDNGVEMQSFMDFVGKAKSGQGKIRGLVDSAGFEKIRTFFLYVLSMGLFSQAGLTLTSAGYSKIEAAAIERKYSSKIGFIDCLVDTALFVCTAGYQVVQGHSVAHIVHSPDAYAEFYDAVELFVQDYDIFEANPALVSEDERIRLSYRLSNLLDQFHAIEATAQSLSRVDKRAIMQMRSKLYMYRAKAKTAKVCQSTRSSPFSILIAGPSSIGKSIVTDILFDSFGKHRNLNVDSDSRYSRVGGMDFWDGFDSKMWCLVLDDIAALHPRSGESDKSVLELLMLINNVPFVPNMAALEKKGSSPFLGQLVIATTNTRHLNVKSYFSYPSAVLRRFPYVVDLSMKEEYDDGEGGFDKSKATPMPNYWRFRVREVKASGRDTVERTVLDTTELGDFLRWYHSAIDTFYNHQSSAASSGSLIQEAKQCETCGIYDFACVCGRDLPLFVPGPWEEPSPQATGPSIPSSRMNSSPWAPRVSGDRWMAQSLMTPVAFVFGMGLGAFLWERVPGYIAEYIQIQLRKMIKARCLSYYHECVDYAQSFFKSERERLKTIGLRVQTRVVKTPRIFLALAGFLVAGVAIKHFYDAVNLQGTVTSMARERKGFTYNSSFVETTRFDEPVKARCMNLEELRKRISSNVVQAHFSSNKVTMSCRLLGVGGEYWLVNNHCIPPGVDHVRVVMARDKGGVGMTIETSIEESLISRDPVNDLALVRLRSVPLRKDLRSYFPATMPTGNAVGEYVDRNDSGDIGVYEMSHITYASRYIDDIQTTLNVATSRCSVETERGMCGMPLIALCGEAKAIIGIHSHAGTNNLRSFAGATLVTSGMVDALISRFDAPVISASEPVLSAQSKRREVGALNHKCPLNYDMEGVASVYGSFRDFRQEPKTRVKPSMISTFLFGKGISTTFTAPVMKDWRPWRLAALDMVNPVTELRESVVTACTDAYINDIVSELPPAALQQLVGPMDEFDAINGVEGVAYLDSIKRSTSAGAPYNKSKKLFLKRMDPDRGLQDPVCLNPEMSQRVREVRRRYAQGECYHPVFTAHLKDEAVSAAKAASGKTRVFCGAPMDWSIVVRENFLGHVRLMQNFKYAFECGVGVVAQSGEWTDMYEYIVKHGEDRIIAGDYKAYDKRMPPLIIMESFRVLIELAQLSGNYSPDEIRALWCIAYDTAFPMVDFNGDLIMFWGSNPSGHPLTVIINSIANSLYMRYAFAESGHDVTTFRQNVSLMTYGDDNIASVAPTCEGFDHTVVQKCLAAVGITYTMADKEAESVPFVNIKDSTFLKRSWRWDEEHRKFAAPLEEESIHKMLCVVVESKTVPKQEQMVDIIHAANEEWWHYGPTVFEARHNLLKEVVVAHELGDWMKARPLATYEELWERHEKNTEDAQFLFAEEN